MEFMTVNPKILLVDDDVTMSPLVREYLDARGFTCTLCHHSFEALTCLKSTAFDLCILDVRMPFKDGFELAKEIQLLSPGVPFLFLTGQSDLEDRIKGLEQGADDYIIKPFSMKELVLRIQAILRRSAHRVQTASLLTNVAIGQYTFNADTRELIWGDTIQRISDLETRLLIMFLQSADGIVRRENALKLLWPEEHLFRDRSLNVFVSHLRQYLRNDPDIEILNIHGSGYRLIVRQ